MARKPSPILLRAERWSPRRWTAARELELHIGSYAALVHLGSLHSSQTADGWRPPLVGNQISSPELIQHLICFPGACLLHHFWFCWMAANRLRARESEAGETMHSGSAGKSSETGSESLTSDRCRGASQRQQHHADFQPPDSIGGTSNSSTGRSMNAARSIDAFLGPGRANDLPMSNSARR